MDKREFKKEVKVPIHCRGCVWGSAKSGVKWVCSMPRCVRYKDEFKPKEMPSEVKRFRIEATIDRIYKTKPLPEADRIVISWLKGMNQ